MLRVWLVIRLSQTQPDDLTAGDLALIRGNSFRRSGMDGAAHDKVPQSEPYVKLSRVPSNLLITQGRDGFDPRGFPGRQKRSQRCDHQQDE